MKRGTTLASFNRWLIQILAVQTEVLGITRWLAFGPGIRIKMRSLSESLQFRSVIIRQDVWLSRLFFQLEDNLGQPAVLKRKPRSPEQSA